MKPWIYSQTLSPWKSTQSHQVLFVLLRLSYTKGGVGISKTIFLACPTRMGGPTSLAHAQFKILKSSQNFWGDPKVSPNFQIRLRYTTKLTSSHFLNFFLKEGSNSRFHSSSKDFTNNSIDLTMESRNIYIYIYIKNSTYHIVISKCKWLTFNVELVSFSIDTYYQKK